MIDRSNPNRVLTAFLAVSIALSGWFIGDGFRRGRAAERYVTVKGVSERFVRADRAYWYLAFTAADDDLTRAQADLDASLAVVLDFVTAGGLPETAVVPQQVDVVDLHARPYRTNENALRFTVKRTVLVRTQRIQEIAALSRQTGELVKQGVILVDSSWPTYTFDRLNEVKPEMIEEATRNARRAAEQFAADSNSRIRSIRRANQGVFQILGRESARIIDPTNQPDKKIRVVSTIQYLLEGG